ncbi:fibronectin type III and SPRY domain-containing protein 1 isoform X1 [Electrophorus electricus]|uniref:fibronectin type III and SPRY domain-containing protein 1 isoform X1 n=1 Tax=Electrophorus electricus TaxID=8005 RepID=UPI0015D01476|nr:fibronectin type III and SPRY domain-containing protein 1 isoform X1 [Electrophorus electricus]
MRTTARGLRSLRDARLPSSISTEAAALGPLPRTWDTRIAHPTPVHGAADMDEQKESLRKIVTTLALKNEEIQNFICCLKQSLQNLEANSVRVQEDLESEFSSLHAVLEELKDGMVTRIKQERASRTYELQNQLSACAKALESSEELLELANQTLCSSETDGFTQAAKDIKDSVTMAPAFRLSLKAKASDSMSHLMVDFTQEREMLRSIKFLPVPATPEIQPSECQVCDNSVLVAWSLPEPDSKIDHYDLEYRRTNHEGPPRAREDYPWMVVEGIRETEYTLTGLRFDTRYMTFRVKACNKAVAGEFSEPVTLETHAFVFKLDAASSHQNLKVEDMSVEWDSSGGKTAALQDIRKEKTRTSSPMHSPARTAVMSPKRAPSARVGRDRFTAESYTVLGDTMIDAGQHYWEVRFDKDSKTFAVGVALRSLGRFDQLGKTSTSWCVHLNNWLQQSLTAKHNNRARMLDCAVPDRIGVYCNYEEGTLCFYNARSKALMHTFRTKFQQPVIPAFMVRGSRMCVEREFFGADGTSGAQRRAVWTEEEQQHQQLQR